MDDRELRAQLAQFHRESYGWARRCCGDNPTEAEEILQTAYLKVLDGRARFDSRASFRTWLLAVIRRTAADQRRRRWLEQVGLLRFESRREPAPPSPAPDEELAQSQTARLFQQALAGLPRRQQEVLQLVFYHGLSLSEAARVMGVSLGSAQTHYERGKARLRQWLQQTHEFDESRFRRAEHPRPIR